MESGYFGKVLDNDDPKKIGRVKVRVNGFYDDVDESMIPWALPKNVSFNRLDPPPIGSEVQIDFIEGEIMCPIWWTYNGKSSSEMGIEDSDYVKSAVLLYKDLKEDYQGDGKVRIMYTDTKGLELELKKEDKIAYFNLRPDNSVYIRNEKFDKVIHLAEKSISLGTEDKSDEPAVLGDTNHQALDHTNDTIKDFSKIIEEHAQKVFTICMGSSILKPLAMPHLQLNIKLASQISGSKYNRNKNYYPKTKSKIVTLD